ncbi:3-hydroxyisobutyryl-CoA hydrolase [Actinoplanes italicus]|uniref:3-hydroxyisobutyryl-CoA hydrolase n=1 Tax=Actinoplanes italicus TaxID=113567 RepID=A0A2T0K289_9ACTN|nr:enoyl-CoA hydratase/isomerase family protein [Actinoplanes italicus]PRX16730.1 enoyl-CoA hydratase [Actinoplanes italicus]GIE31140.1 3-hydroxyisobutyryl-CoA hydrolase [Actinoplanes italicus]
MSEPPVIARVTDGLGRLTLNRPAAINALTAEMVGILRRTLADWAESDTVHTVLIDGAGPRGLCAGGDLRAMHADAVSGGTGSLDFWAEEYRLNADIATYPKPIVTWMDGLVMGGGIGVSAHASVRIVTERSRLAMPEVGIGFHPDVGGSWLLAHAPGEIGTHLALTGGSIGAADAITAGLADHFMAADRLSDLVKALTGTKSPAPTACDGTALPAGRDAATESRAGQVAASLAVKPPPGVLDAARTWIDECYAGDDVEAIIDRLARHPSPDAQAAAKEVATKSPTSLVVALRSVRSASRLPGLQEALDQEYRLSAALLRLPDLAEGIRAQIIDKDRRPRWQPSTLAEMDPAVVDACFAG